MWPVQIEMSPEYKIHTGVFCLFVCLFVLNSWVKKHSPQDNSLLFIYLFFLAGLDLRCCTRAFSSCVEWGPLFVAVRGLLIAVTSLVKHGL